MVPSAFLHSLLSLGKNELTHCDAFSNMSSSPVVLAFSGGLDTSFCIPYLRELGYEVITLLVDTGGFTTEEMSYIATRSRELGAVEHVIADAGTAIWDEVVVPLVRGGQLYQGQYPLLCSDRYLIVRRSLELCRERGTSLFAHGCTGMGNDQVRFDLTVRALGDFKILAPIREIQKEHANVREYERGYLEQRGFSVRARTTRYSVNQNLLGVTASGSEIDRFEAPGDETYTLTAPPERWPRGRERVRITFEQGIATALDGRLLAGPKLLQELNQRLGAYGIGRGIYTGDTTIGLKGRIVFEAPGIKGLLLAHQALEESILSQQQNAFKPLVAQRWVELVYKGFFHDPLKKDLDALLTSSQRFVSGEVTLELVGGAAHAVSIESPHILHARDAVYAQSASWGAREAEGFIQLFGMSSTLSAQLNPIDRL